MSRIKLFVSRHKQDTQTVMGFCTFTLCASLFALLANS